jgi:hypothetical protein
VTSKDRSKLSSSRSVTTIAQLGRAELAALLLHVLALLDGRQNRRVGGRPAHAIRFQFLHQRRFVEPRRRLGEMLLGLDGLEAQLLALRYQRQPILQLLVVLVLRVLAFLVDFRNPLNFGTLPVARNKYVAPSLPWASTSMVVWSNTAGVICDATKRIQISRYSFSSSS